MKYLLLFCLMLPLAASAQNEAPVVTNKKLKVVFHLTTNDTLAHKALMKQLNNFLVAAPKSKIEVVCHNNGITLLQGSTTKQMEKIKEMHGRGVDFVACENTLRERKIAKTDLVPYCRTVPAGIVEVAIKQDQGWSYIKAGF